MEQNRPIASNKVWTSVRMLLFMVTKNMSKTKLLLDLNLLIKRGNIARKTLQNLILHHHHHPPPPTEDYKFKKNKQKMSSTVNGNHDEIFVDPSVLKALEMSTASPAVNGYEKSPVVRQLRITDSPFPLTNGEEDSYLDEAAEKFIIKFYNDLRRQS